MKWIFEEQRFRRVYLLCFHKQFMHKIAYCGKKKVLFFGNFRFQKELRIQCVPKVLQSLLGPLRVFSPILKHI